MERGSVVNAALNEREDTTVLHDLVEKCEKLDGPCREMDKEIAVSSGEYVTSRHHPGMLAHKDSPNQFGYFFPAYTASIDAAMKLVPDREFICIDGPRRYLHIPTPVPNYWRACLGYTKSGQVWAKTPALALCIAALRARSQGGE